MLNQNNWIEHRAVYADAGLEVEFKYPNNLVIARQIDNCICVGINTEYYEENQASPEDNTRQWCICLFDSNEYSADYMISSWENSLYCEVVAIRDTVSIENNRAVRATMKSKVSRGSYKQLIYFNKFSTLIEIVNIDESTSEDFEIFWKSIKIEKYKNP